MSIIEALRAKILADNYEITGHAFEEGKEDSLDFIDIENIVLYGKIIKEYLNDQRGKRYLIEGYSMDKRVAYVICRILHSGKLRIITVYAEK